MSNSGLYRDFENLKDRYFFLFLTALPFILFGFALSYPFVMDDWLTVYSNPAVTSGVPWGEFFTNAKTVASPLSQMGQDIYRPLATLTFRINYMFAGLDPRGFRIFSFLLHGLNAGLLFLLFRRFLKKEEALFGALLFLIHPVQIESLVWITQRSNLMAAAGIFSALILWSQKDKGLREYSAIAALFVFSFLSKELALGLPVFLILLSLWNRFRGSNPAPFEKAALLSYLGLAGCLFFFRKSVLGVWGQGVASHFSFGESLYRAWVGLGLYLKNLIWPWGLNVNMVMPPDTGAQAGFLLLGTLFFVASVWFAFRSKKSGWVWAFLLFFVFWLPHSGFLPTLTFAADRFLYVMMAGFALGAACLLAKLKDLRQKAGVMGLVLVYLFSAGFLRALDWRSERVLWESSLSQNPLSPESWAAYGRSLLFEKEPALAEQAFGRALNLNPSPLLERDIQVYLETINRLKGKGN